MLKQNAASGKKGTRHVSLIVRWVSIVAMTIMVSFLVFSAVVYNTVKQEALSQQKDTSNEVVNVLRKRLIGIDDELEITNVVQQLSPNTRRILTGWPALSENDNSNSSVFGDSVLSTVTNPDIISAMRSSSTTARAPLNWSSSPVRARVWSRKARMGKVLFMSTGRSETGRAIN